MSAEQKEIYISVAKDFSETPGGRYKKEGDFSGEEFLHRILLDNYFGATLLGTKVIIDLDGCMGCPPSFIDGSFGELARRFKDKNIFDVIELVSKKDPELPDKIKEIVYPQ